MLTSCITITPISTFSIAIEEVVGGGEDIPLERTLLTSTAARPRMGKSCV